MPFNGLTSFLQLCHISGNGRLNGVNALQRAYIISTCHPAGFIGGAEDVSMPFNGLTSFLQLL